MRVALIFPIILMGCSGLGVGSLLGVGKNKDEEVARLSGDSLCGVSSILGEVHGPVDPGGNACGIDNAVRVTSVGGVSLTQGSLMNCRTARVLNSWVENEMKPIVGKQGGGVESLQVAAHYVCRTRNHRKGARLSEHSKGNAIDISAFNLRDGSQLTVQGDWNNGRTLKQLHKSACGPFGTVLGPGSDGYHEDHFHFDTAQHGNGPYCR